VQSTEQTVQSTETKAERKARKILEKANKSQAQYNASATKNYVVCLKWGQKYSADYVNKLYNMVKRNTTVDYEFVCFTESKRDVNKEIRIEPLPNIPVEGWWYKPWFVSAELPLKGNILYLDLDLIVFDNMDKFFTYKPEKDFVIIRDFNRHHRRGYEKINSSVFRVHSGARQIQYANYVNDRVNVTRRLHGDQDWMYKYCEPWEYWPDEWVQSYKWEMKGRHTLGMVNGRRNFIDQTPPKILPETSIAVYHGKPNMDEADDPWTKQNWY